MGVLRGVSSTSKHTGVSAQGGVLFSFINDKNKSNYMQIPHTKEFNDDTAATSRQPSLPPILPVSSERLRERLAAL